MQDVIRDKAIPHSVNSSANLGNINLFYRIGNEKEDIRIALVDKFIRNGAK